MAAKKGYTVQFVNNQVRVLNKNESESSTKVENKVGGVVQRDENNKFKFVPNTIDLEFDAFVKQFIDKIMSMGLNIKNVDEIVEMCQKLIEKQHTLFENTLKKTDDNVDTKIVNVSQAATSYSCNKLKELKTDYLRKKYIKSNEYFVAPEEKAICLKWCVKRVPHNDLHYDHTKQGTYQIVKPSKTLKALFSNPDFRKLFFEYNQNKHKCVSGVYERYCCGSAFQDSLFFQSNPNCVHLQIGFDEFETCDALKSKATVHKVLAVYLKILNMPQKYLSKIDNIFLVMLCESINFQKSGVDVIMSDIIDDLIMLEKDGIKIDENIRVKAGLTSVCADNAGANMVLGFSESFSANYYCRKCSMHKHEAQKSIKENEKVMRTISEYDKEIEKLKTNPNLELKETKGIRRACVFNKLSSFNVLNNPTMDMMHDCAEGIVISFSTKFFEYCVTNEICDESELVRRIRDCNYGYLNSRNKPSKLKLSRANLGQNATQNLCIIKHLPLIFYDKRRELKKVWPILIHLLKSLSIVYSKVISERYIVILEKHIKLHLSGYMKVFKKSLKPKHHNFTHYPNQIRQMGPLVECTMLHYEAKHSFFTKMARNTNNFINISKTLAEKSQLIMCGKVHSFKDEMTVSPKSYPITKCYEFGKYKSFLNESICDYSAVNYVKVNSYIYRKGIMLVENHEVFEIIYVLRNQNEYFLLCHLYDFVKYETSLNSIKIKRSELSAANMQLLKIHGLKNGQPLEKKICDGSIYLYVENLDVFNRFT